MKYIWQTSRWPDLYWDSDALLKVLSETRFKQGMYMKRLQGLGFDVVCKAQLDNLVEDAKNTAEIEGVKLDPEGIRSSAAKRLGLPTAGLRNVNDQRIDGLVEVLLDATSNYMDPLTAHRLKGWQAAMFPTGFSGIRKITVGNWRTDKQGPMQLISGRYGRETVHFVAPPATDLMHEMAAFLDWFEDDTHTEGLLKAALAHLKFVTIHPFSDGNGRIARTVSDMQLSRTEKEARRFYSVSTQIRKERKQYYEILERTQKGDGDITEWLIWFLERMQRAICVSDLFLDCVTIKTRFWQTHHALSLNHRQRKVLNKLLDAEPEGFEGGLTNRKYVSMTRTSRATAQRELADLVNKGVLVRNTSGGRSISYRINSW